MLANGAVVSGSIASGQIGTAHIASGGVLSANVASGQIGIYHLASGLPITSGMITSGDLGQGAVVSANVASGAIAFAVPSFSGQPGTGTTQGLITIDWYNKRIWAYVSGSWAYASLT